MFSKVLTALSVLIWVVGCSAGQTQERIGAGGPRLESPPSQRPHAERTQEVGATGKSRPPTQPAGRPSADNPPPLKIGEVESWAYQLQYADPWDSATELAASPYDLLVVDPYAERYADEGTFNPRQWVSILKASLAHDHIHRKLVIAYVNIGQAEDYREYWTWSRGWDCRRPLPSGWPDFILTCDTDGWEGNYPVAYWDKDWQDILFNGDLHSGASKQPATGSIAGILSDGFDGIYMDWVAGFEDAAVVSAARNAGLDPAEEMSRYIQKIKTYTNRIDPAFILIQQNGAALAEEHPASLQAVDAIAQECVWYCGKVSDSWDDPQGYNIPVSREDSDEILGYLARYQAAGVPVFDIDYALTYAPDTYKKAAREGYIPYVSRTSLSRLTTTPPLDNINNNW